MSNIRIEPLGRKDRVGNKGRGGGGATLNASSVRVKQLRHVVVEAVQVVEDPPESLVLELVEAGKVYLY
jgi:hypothetical protein